MILVSEAGSMRSSGFSAASTCPLERSPTIHERPMTEGGCGAAACTAAARNQHRRKAKRGMEEAKKGRIIKRASSAL